MSLPVVKEGQPPQRDAVKKKWPYLETAELDDKYNDCLRQYQSENTALFFHVVSSLSLAGEWEQHDYDHIDRHFVNGDLRDGNGLLKWFLSFHDITTPAKHPHGVVLLKPMFNYRKGSGHGRSTVREATPGTIRQSP